MDFLDRARAAAARFMYGRNGMDSLNWTMLAGYVALYILQGIAGAVLKSFLLVRLFGFVDSILALVVLYRAFSRNLERRQEENRTWLSWSGGTFGGARKLRDGAGAAAARLKDREHRYFTCGTCGTVCRVPKGKGKIQITCPKCGGKFQVKT